jgi:hypothetical protein
MRRLPVPAPPAVIRLAFPTNRPPEDGTAAASRRNLARC